MDKAIPIALLFASTFLWQNMLLFMKWLETSIPLLITTNITAIEVMPIYNTQIFCGTRSKAMWLQRYLQSISQRGFSEIHINGQRLGNSRLKCWHNIIGGIKEKNCKSNEGKIYCYFQITLKQKFQFGFTNYTLWHLREPSGKKVLGFHENNRRWRFPMEFNIHLFVPSVAEIIM